MVFKLKTAEIARNYDVHGFIVSFFSRRELGPPVVKEHKVWKVMDTVEIKSLNTVSYDAKPRFSLTLSDGLITRLGLVARIRVSGETRKSTENVWISVAALLSAGTCFSSGFSSFSCWSGSGVRRKRFLLIVVAGVSTLYHWGVTAALMTFPERWRSFTKTSVPDPIRGKSFALCLLLNNVCCFSLLMLSFSRRFSRSCHCGLSWAAFPSTTGQEKTWMLMTLICRPVIL